MRRTRRRPLAVLALLALLALVAAACGGGDDDVSSDTSDDTSDDTTDDTRAESSEETKPDDTRPEETEPDDDPEEASMAIVDGVVEALGLPLTPAQESCLGEELVEEFDADELETLRDDQTLTDDLAERASEVLELCLPLDDVIYLAGIEQGLAPADADCVAEFIAAEFTWADFISGDETILDTFADAGEECGVGPGSGSTISVPTLPPIGTTTTRPAVTTTAPASGGAAPPGTEVSIYDAAVGECWDEAPFLAGGQVYTVLDCAASHDTETFAVFDLPDGAWPGDTAVQNDADAGCTSRFADYVGIDYLQSQYYLSYYSPTEDTWNDPSLRDREVVCLLYVPVEPGNDDAGREQTTGSAAGSGR
jgi:hypothetical protein